MSETITLKRNLKIKSGAVKRLLKEHTGYKNEVTQMQLKHDKLVADGADEWDVKNAARMIEESRKMVQDVDERLGSNVQDLRDLIVRAQKIEELVGSEELQAADDILEEASV